MKHSELKRRLQKAGCRLYHYGGEHDIWINPKTGVTDEIPRHASKEIGKGLADKIIKKLIGK